MIDKISILVLVLVVVQTDATNQLRYINQQGGYMPQQEIQFFLETVNQASKLYGSDISNNLKYITTQMNYQFGSHANSYIVSIQPQICASLQWIQVVYSHWITRVNINSNNPDWSYLVYLTKRSETNPKIIGPIAGKGNGMNDQTQTLIQNIVKKNQVWKNCMSNSDILDMGKQIQFLTRDKYNVICGTKDTYLYGGFRDDKWIIVQTDCCRYTFTII